MPSVNLGLKIIGERFPTDSDEAKAFNYMLDFHHIFSSSWGPKDDGASMDGPGTLAREAIKKGISSGRNGKGAIYVFASGNGGSYGDNCNFDSYANSPYTISVSTIQPDGTLPSYAEQCAAHFVVAPGGGKGKFVATTDINSLCTEDHTGTSAAAPMVSAVIALLLQKRNDLGWRDVQHLIVRSTSLNDPSDKDWLPNRAGFMVNHKYGFGLIDAAKVLENSKDWQLVPATQIKVETNSYWSGETIPLSPSLLRVTHRVRRTDAGLLRHLEHVQVTLTAKHPSRGALKVTLYSPERRSYSVLAAPRWNDNSTKGYNGWVFSTVRHWDEDVIGTWTIEIQDTRLSGRSVTLGSLQYWKIEFLGRCSEEDVSVLDNGDRVCGPGKESSLGSSWLIIIGGISILAIGAYFGISKMKPRWPNPRFSSIQNLRRNMGFGSAILLKAEEGLGKSSYEEIPTVQTTSDLVAGLGSVSKNPPSKPLLLIDLDAGSRDNVPSKSVYSNDTMALRSYGSRQFNNDPSATPFDQTQSPFSLKDGESPSKPVGSPSHPGVLTGSIVANKAMAKVDGTSSPSGLRREKTRSMASLTRISSLPRLDTLPSRDKGKYEH
jgi:subtilisin-like proprotein convertase family protein